MATPWFCGERDDFVELPAAVKLEMAYEHAEQKGNIHEYLGTLMQLAQAHSSVVEVGVRGGISTLAWLRGLAFWIGKLLLLLLLLLASSALYYYYELL